MKYLSKALVFIAVIVVLARLALDGQIGLVSLVLMLVGATCLPHLAVGGGGK